MAITIQHQPDNSYVYPAYAPIEYLLSSDNTAESGFKIICKVFYEPTSLLVSTQQINIRPSSTQAILSIQDVVKSFLTSQYSLLDGDSVGIQNYSLTAFNVTFQEYYDGALQGQVEISDSLYANNASPKYIQFASNHWQEYQLSNTQQQKLLLSNFNNNKIQDTYFSATFSGSDNWLKVKEDQKLQIQWIQRSSTASFMVELLTIGADFGTISVSILNNPNTTEGQYSLDVGRQEVTSHAWDNAPNFTNAKYYAICFSSSGAAPFSSKRYLYEIDNCDTNYTNYELHYLNRWGGFDSFVFDGKSTETTNVDKTFAKHSTDRINGTSLQYTTSAQRTRAFNTSVRESYSLNSRLLSDFESDGLEDLISSPEVYWNSPDGFVNVNVQGTTYERKRSENGKVFSLALTMTVDNSDKRQW
tara:strand:+ start:8262 stop:9509 length:1248 start_codon:yes stop_codon:yes gene_type:complete